MGEEQKETGLVLILDMLKTLRNDNNIDHSEIKGMLREQNGRIRKLERWQGKIIGIAIGVGIASGFGSNALLSYLLN